MNRGSSVFGRNSFDVINYEHVERNLLRFEMEAKLLLNRGEDGGKLRLSRAFGGVGEFEVVCTGNARFVDDRMAERMGKDRGKEIQRSSLEIDAIGQNVRVGIFALASWSLEPDLASTSAKPWTSRVSRWNAR